MIIDWLRGLVTAATTEDCCDVAVDLAEAFGGMVQLKYPVAPGGDGQGGVRGHAADADRARRGLLAGRAIRTRRPRGVATYLRAVTQPDSHPVALSITYVDS